MAVRLWAHASQKELHFGTSQLCCVSVMQLCHAELICNDGQVIDVGHAALQMHDGHWHAHLSRAGLQQIWKMERGALL